MKARKVVTYIRVSTAKQGVSGLGLEAQKEAIRQYLDTGDFELLKEFKEVESGKRQDRPELQKALTHCQLTGATLLVAKLDRLSRDIHFITSLQKAGVEFTVCDFPTANNFTINIFAALAEYERELISQRTIAALARSKKRKGVMGAENLKNHAEAGRVSGRKARIGKADRFAEKVGPMIHEFKKQGNTLTGIADKLNEQKILTPRGHRKNGEAIQWTATAVKNVLARIGEREQGKLLSIHSALS